MVLDKVWEEIKRIEEVKLKGDYEKNIPNEYPIIADPGILTNKELLAHRIGDTQFTIIGYQKLAEIHQVDSDEGDQAPVPY